jgi:large repetitive protein
MITVNPQPASTFTQSADQCLSGNSFNFTNTGSSGTGYTYSWTLAGGTPGTSTLNDITGVTFNTAGTHTITHFITASGGCTATSTSTITIYQSPTGQATTTSATACGSSIGTITIGATTGGTSPYTYSVNGSTFTGTTSYTGFSAGTYSVIVKDFNGCTYTTNATVANSTGPTAQALTTTNSTCGNANGTIDLGATTGGTSPYLYSIDGGSYTTNTTYSGIAQGTHVVNVKDVNGCIFSASANVTDIPGPSAQNVSMVNSTCGNANGSINIGSTTGGTGPYLYSVDGSAYTTNTNYSGITAGMYIVSTKDANGCIYNTSANVTDSPGPSAQNVSTINSTCGNANGSINIGSTTGGTGSYTYSLNGSGYITTIAYTGLAAGTYTVSVKDANGCVYSTTANVIDSPGPSAASVTTTNSTCQGTDGAVTIGTITGGASPYSYSFDGNGFTANTDYTGLIAGTYPIIVKDVNGCTFNTSGTVGNTGTIPSTPTIIQSGLILTSSSATGNQWYLNGTTIPGAINQNYTITANGDYSVVVTLNGCSSITSAITTVTGVGIEESVNPYSLSVYPNPNNGNFIISFMSPDKGSFIVQIINTLGQIIYSDDVRDFTGIYKKEMSVVEYGQGVYSISLTNSNNETVKKIVVY